MGSKWHDCFILVWQVTLDDQASKVIDFQIVWSSSPTISEYKSYFSTPEFIEFPTEVPGENAYAYYYPPANPIYQASQEEKPPLLLKSHGNYIPFHFRRWTKSNLQVLFIQCMQACLGLNFMTASRSQKCAYFYTWN